jgi:ferritin
MDGRLLAEFNRHIAIEIRNSLAYLAAYAWLRANDWEGFAKGMKNENIDEMGHAQNFVKYCARRDDVAKIAAESPENFEDADPARLVQFAADLEDETEESMRRLVKVAFEVGDDDAIEYVSGKLLEQTKLAKQARQFAAEIERASHDSGALVILNRQLENNKY